MTMTLPHIEIQNQWQIPRELASLVAARDRVCIYCAKAFTPIGPSGNRRASWEHIINDVNLITLENIAICCVGCNSSKSRKELRIWLQTPYCANNSISEKTFAPVALAALQLQRELEGHDLEEASAQVSIDFRFGQATTTEPPKNAA